MSLCVCVSEFVCVCVCGGGGGGAHEDDIKNKATSCNNSHTAKIEQNSYSFLFSSFLFFSMRFKRHHKYNIVLGIFKTQ